MTTHYRSGMVTRPEFVIGSCFSPLNFEKKRVGYTWGMEGCPSVQRLSGADQFIDAHSLGLNGVVSSIYID